MGQSGASIVAAATLTFLSGHGGMAGMTKISEILVKTLASYAAGPVFAVPGESYLAVMDALYDVSATMPFITCRHEAAAAHMAASVGRLTGKPGIAMVTRGPGACHAAIGVHAAFQDSAPMLLIVGQVGTDMRGREAFQEIDYQQMFGSVAKKVVLLDQPHRTAELVARACALATEGRPGPVVVVLPEDILERDVAAVPADAPLVDLPVAGGHRAAPVVDAATLEMIRAALADARQPMLWVGGGGWQAEASAALMRFAENWSLPVVTAWRRKDSFDNQHPLYAGEMGLGMNPHLRARVAQADLILALGTRLGEVTSQAYALPLASQKLIHLHIDSEALYGVRQPWCGAQCDVQRAIISLAAMPADATQAAHRTAWAQAARQDYENWIVPTDVAAGVNMAQVITDLSRRLGPEAIWCNGAGNFAAWVHRFHQHRQTQTQLAPTSGAMGYGIPAALAAKLLHPSKPVVVVAGDGDFLMSAQELATAQQYGAAIIVLVVDNGQYGTIRMHQAQHYPGRFYGTALANPDFVAMAHSFGLCARLVARTEDFAPALEALLAEAQGKSILLHLRTDPMEIAPGRRLAETERPL